VENHLIALGATFNAPGVAPRRFLGSYGELAIAVYTGSTSSAEL